MRAWFSRWAAVALMCGVAIASSAQANTVADRLADLKQTLQAVRSTQPSNLELEAGPELTPVKMALRHWVEAQLPPPTKPGRIQGTIVTPDAASLSALARQMNGALDEAEVTCGDVDLASYRCKGIDGPTDIFFSERGHVGRVQFGLLDYGRYLLVVTGVGVMCGEDQSAYLYKPDGSRWKLVFASEQDDYRKGVYTVQNFTEIAVSPRAGEGQPDTPPLVATLGYGPWCSSTWSSLYTRLWRLSDTTVSPPSLAHRDDFMWWGNDDFGAARLTSDDFLVQFTTASMDSGIHNRKRVLRYWVGPGGKVDRVDPVALRPMDFVDEWLTSDWKEAARWIESRSDRKTLIAAHRQGRAEFDDTGKRCRKDRSLWQIALANGQYFEVRWTAPYVFRLVAVSGKPFVGCDIADPRAEEDASLFPETQWHPTD